MERMFERRIVQTNPTNPTANINIVTNKVDYFEKAGSLRMGVVNLRCIEPSLGGEYGSIRSRLRSRGWPW